MIKKKKKAQIQPSSALRTYSSKTEIHKDGLVFSLKSASVREKRRNLVPFYSRIFSDFNAVHFWTFPTFYVVVQCQIWRIVNLVYLFSSIFDGNFATRDF